MGKESLDRVAIDLDQMISCEVELGLFLILDHLCLFRVLVEPDVGAFCLVSKLLVVDCCLLDLYVDLDPFAQYFFHVFIINKVQRRLLVSIEQLDVHGELQLADLHTSAVINVLLVAYIKQIINRLQVLEHDSDRDPLFSQRPAKRLVVIVMSALSFLLEPALFCLVVLLLDFEVNLVHEDVVRNHACCVFVVAVLIYFDLDSGDPRTIRGHFSEDIGLVHDVVAFQFSTDDVGFINFGDKFLKLLIYFSQLLCLLFFVELAFHLALHFILHLLLCFLNCLFFLTHLYLKLNLFLLELQLQFGVFLLSLG